MDKTEGMEGEEERREVVKGKSVLPFGAVEVKSSTLGRVEGAFFLRLQMLATEGLISK